MLQLKNNTPFKAAIALFPNEKGVDTLYVTIKATFTLGETSTVAEQQQPVRLADEYWGEPGHSALKYASDVHLAKPSTDVMVIGAAHAPEGKPVPSLDVSVQAGPRKKVIRVFGDRKWYRYENDLRISPPASFVTMPLVYDRAYGGVCEIDGKMTFEPRNPVGRGFAGERDLAEMDRQPLPNLEDPAHLITFPNDQPAPACFGPVAPSWEPRKSFAGTYNEKWQKEQAPYLPEDFQSNYFNAAHPDLAGPGYLHGGEPVTITNMSPDGAMRFTLPTCEFDVMVQIEDRTETPPMNLETVLIEPDEKRFSLLWRGFVECDKKPLKVSQITVDLKGEGAEGMVDE
jgi:hypothetical protein